MRNLKRALSLALAAVMVIGMMVVGAGAVSFNDFTDKDEIVNADAVGMVTELGIINGLPGGTYGPTQNIDRASFVKMVALTFNGGSEPMLPDGNKVSYVDTAGTWASAYIEYCTNLGFVAGDGTTGKFNPTNPVTVSQAAKMLLVALGYNADVEQYVGAQWQMNVDADANTAGLYDGLSGSTSANLTRDNAAQMIYNALDSAMMKYEGVYDLTTGTMKPQRAELDKTLLEAKFGAEKKEGVVFANEFGSALATGTTKEGYTTLMIENKDKAAGEEEWITVDVKVGTSAELLGRTVTVYVKNYKNGTWTTVFGAPIVNGDNTIAKISAGYIDDADGLSKELKSQGITSIKGAYLMTNFAEDGKLAAKNDSAMSALAAKTGNGVEITVIDNIMDVNFVIVTHKIAGTVAAYNTKGNDGDGYITVSNLISADSKITGAKFEDVVGVEDVEKDDVVLFYELDDTYYIEKADSVTVTPTSTKANTVKVGSESYKASALSARYNSDGEKELAAAVSLGDEATFYLDNAGYVVYVDAETEPDQYMFITGANASAKPGFYSLTIKGVLSDGTSVTVDVNKLNGKSLSDAFAAIKGSGTSAEVEAAVEAAITDEMATYSVKNTNTYNVTIKEDTHTITQVKNNVPSLEGEGAIANSKTMFLIGDKDGDFKAYTGIASVPTVKNADGKTAVYHCFAKDNVAAFVVVTNAATSGSAKGIYILSKNVSVSKVDGSNVYTIDAIVNGEYNEALVVESDSKPGQMTRGYYANVTLNGDGSVSLSDLDGMTPDAGSKVVKFGDGVIKSQKSSTLTYDKDTVVIVIGDGDPIVDASIDEIIFVGSKADDIPDNSSVVLVAGTDDNAGHADYVYIIR